MWRGLRGRQLIHYYFRKIEILCATPKRITYLRHERGQTAERLPPSHAGSPSGSTGGAGVIERAKRQRGERRDPRVALETQSNLAVVPVELLLREVVDRLGATVQIVVSSEAAAAARAGITIEYTFLSKDELTVLTGRRMKSKQIDQLRQMGVPFWVNATGHPVVARSTIGGMPPASPTKTPWVPSVLKKK